MIDRHDMLRATFHQGSGARRSAFTGRPTGLQVIPLQHVNEADFYQSIAAEARVLSISNRDRHFARTCSSAVPRKRSLLLNFHPIISDAYSIRTFLLEFGGLYQACCGKTEMPRLAAAAPTRTLWLGRKATLPATTENDMWAYWRDQFVDHEPDLALPTDRPRTALAGARQISFLQDLNMSLVARLEQLAQKEKSEPRYGSARCLIRPAASLAAGTSSHFYIPRLGRPTEDFPGLSATLLPWALYGRTFPEIPFHRSSTAGPLPNALRACPGTSIFLFPFC
ncbi:condensation domain-containing protein [Sinorhizobium psoraleae]|uniref:Condensation domain-containing protein n=1 Tax=Sinorhizobium psoraleae TaxID=520838 RepID=A0ABT4KPE6_9HYPH|nr:condensation domain-containing protein [Sinorhizobium psoraleae]MCZ4093733.1 condensation domain-containing protein [Sinorhizobium psoraleae]